MAGLVPAFFYNRCWYIDPALSLRRQSKDEPGSGAAGETGTGDAMVREIERVLSPATFQPTYAAACTASVSSIQPPPSTRSPA
jgi:hypothetical protein